MRAGRCGVGRAEGHLAEYACMAEKRGFDEVVESAVKEIQEETAQEETAQEVSKDVEEAPQASFRFRFSRGLLVFS